MSWSTRRLDCSQLTLGAGYNATAARRDIDTGNSLVMTLQFILELERIADLAVEVNGSVSCDSERIVVC